MEPQELSMAKTITLPLSTWTAVEQYARSQGMPVNRALSLLAMHGLALIEAAKR